MLQVTDKAQPILDTRPDSNSELDILMRATSADAKTWLGTAPGGADVIRTFTVANPQEIMQAMGDAVTDSSPNAGENTDNTANPQENASALAQKVNSATAWLRDGVKGGKDARGMLGKFIDALNGIAIGIAADLAPQIQREKAEAKLANLSLNAADQPDQSARAIAIPEVNNAEQIKQTILAPSASTTDKVQKSAVALPIDKVKKTVKIGVAKVAKDKAKQKQSNVAQLIKKRIVIPGPQALTGQPKDAPQAAVAPQQKTAKVVLKVPAYVAQTSKAKTTSSAKPAATQSSSVKSANLNPEKLMTKLANLGQWGLNLKYETPGLTGKWASGFLHNKPATFGKGQIVPAQGKKLG